jgi:pimeloyl-ACP methyl ester carboxylesterase
VTFLDCNGLRCHVQRLGPPEGTPVRGTVLLIHGMLTDSLASYYFTLGPTLAAAGHDVIMYDLRGHGRSARPVSGYQLEHFLDDAEALLDGLGVDGPVHLLGNSFGATVAFALALRRPEQVASIVCLESMPPTATWITQIDDVLQRCLAGLPDEEAIALIDETHGAHTARMSRRAARMLSTTALAGELPETVPLTAEDLRGIRCPVLAVYGSESAMVEQLEWLEQALPDCRSVVLQGQEHSVLIEATEALRRLALAWLDELEAAPVG